MIKIKEKLIKFLYHAKVLEYVVNKKSQKSTLILAYHRIQPFNYLKNNKIMPGMFVSAESFELHMLWLKKRFNIIPLSDVIDKIANKQKWDEPLCAITFDDGWYDNYEYAYPILKENNIPATIFLIGNYIGKSEPNCWDLCFEIIKNCDNIPDELTGIPELDASLTKDQTNKTNKTEKARKTINIIRTLPSSLFKKVHTILKEFYYNNLDFNSINPEYRMLGWNEITKLYQNNIDFGFHSKSHFMLPNVNINELAFELDPHWDEAENYKIELKKILCYPDGKYNKNIIKQIRELGFVGGASLESGYNNYMSNPFITRRVNLHEDICSSLPLFISSIGLFNSSKIKKITNVINNRI